MCKEIRVVERELFGLDFECYLIISFYSFGLSRLGKTIFQLTSFGYAIHVSLFIAEWYNLSRTWKCGIGILNFWQSTIA